MVQATSNKQNKQYNRKKWQTQCKKSCTLLLRKKVNRLETPPLHVIASCCVFARPLCYMFLLVTISALLRPTLSTASARYSLTLFVVVKSHYFYYLY
jgi:hypothetical protein